MEAVRNALGNLRLRIEKSSVRMKDAEARTKILETDLEKKDAEIISLQDRLSLSRRLVALANEWDRARRKLQEVEKRIEVADAKVETLSTHLERVQNEADAFQTQYMDLRIKQREVEAELTELLT